MKRLFVEKFVIHLIFAKESIIQILLHALESMVAEQMLGFESFVTRALHVYPQVATACGMFCESNMDTTCSTVSHPLCDLHASPLCLNTDFSLLQFALASGFYLVDSKHSGFSSRLKLFSAVGPNFAKLEITTHYSQGSWGPQNVKVETQFLVKMGTYGKPSFVK